MKESKLHKKWNCKMIPLLITIFLISMLGGCGYVDEEELLDYAEDYLYEVITEELTEYYESEDWEEFDYESIPDYDGTPYVEVNDNVPYFTEEELETESYEYYGALDSLERCTVVMACLSEDTMPEEDEERGSISSVLPTGWESIQYDCIVSGSLYNRCHLIGWQLSAENANECNLVTGTRYMNIEMLEYENLVDDYIEETGNHVMYRVTPIFEGDDLLCQGLLMEGYSVEDNGAGIFYNVFFYNVQPGIELDYETGASWYSGEFLDLDASTVDYEAAGLE